MATRSRKIGLVLGSGGARGWAHFGVLRALDEAGVRPDVIAGTSAGAMVGAFYAAGRIRDLYELANHLQWKDVVYYFSDLSRTGRGLVNGRRIEEVFRGVLGHLTIEELPVPFAAVATDVQSGKAVVFRTGDLVDAIRASISIPGIFAPVELRGRVLVDGGLVDPVPVKVARSMGAEVIIAVNVLGALHAPAKAPSRPAPSRARSESLPDIWNSTPNGSFIEKVKRTAAAIDVGATIRNRPWLKKDRKLHMFDVLSNAIRIMEIQIAEASLERDKPDIVIRPRGGDIAVLEFDSIDQSERAGYEAARGQVAAIRDRMAK